MSKIKTYGKEIQNRARQLKKKDSKLKHQDAIKKASKQLKDEGLFCVAKKTNSSAWSKFWNG